MLLLRSNENMRQWALENLSYAQPLPREFMQLQQKSKETQALDYLTGRFKKTFFDFLFPYCNCS